VTQFVYRGLSSQVVQELDGSGAAIRTYAWDATGRQLYTKIGSSVYYEITNLHGDVVALATTTALAGSVHFDPWGNRLNGAGTTIPYGFQGAAGSWTDATTSFVSMGARWYYPRDSVFLSSDPEAGTANPRTPLAGLRWLYALDNPLAYSDPSGLRIIIDDGGGYLPSPQPAAPSTQPAVYTPPAKPKPPAPCDWWCHAKNGWNAATQIVNVRPDPGGVQDNLIELGNHMDSGWKQRYRDTLASSADWVNGTRSDLVSGDPYRIARGTAGAVVFASNFVPVGRAATLAKDASEVAIIQAVEHAPQIERVVSEAAPQVERFLAPKVERFVAELTARANELHTFLPSAIAQRMRTTAVMEAMDEAGNTIRLVASSRSTVGPAIRGALNVGEIAVKGLVPMHAEEKLLTMATQMGLKPIAIGVSRAPCGACSALLRLAGL
jgi:RHS repeat-associated protein